MSIPPTRSRAGQYTEWATNVSGGQQPGYPKTTDVVVYDCQAQQPAKQSVPFRYRIKSWVYKGQVYTRVKGYRPKSIRYAPNTWRDPKPYSGSFSRGNVTHFNGTVQTYNPNAPTVTNTIAGDLDVNRFGVSCPAIPAPSAGLGNEAVIKALNNLKGQSVNLAVAMAERTETAELLIGTLAGLSKAARSLRRGDMRGVATGLGLTHPPKRPGGNLSFSQKWLELQYGWMPLYNDVYGCVSALHQRDQDDPKRYTVTAKGRVKVPFRTYSPPRVIQAGVRAANTTEGFEGVFVRLDYYLENPLLASLSSLGITNPAEVVWERVPFSFAVDWFLPIGRYLSALDATLGYKFRAGSQTWLFRRKYDGWISAGPTPGFQFLPGTVWGASHVEQLSISRSVFSSSPLPRVPSFKNPFPKNGIHIANAIALFSSSMRLT